MSMNLVVLFSLILATGMLVDGAIVVAEYADRKMAEGGERREAYPASPRCRDGVAGNLVDRDDDRGVPTDGVLDRDRRRIHEIPPPRC